MRELFTVSEYCREKLILTIKETVLKDFEEDTLEKLLVTKLEKALMRRMQWLFLFEVRNTADEERNEFYGHKM